MKAVKVRWLDSCSKGGWCTPEEAESIQEIESAGWLVREEKDFIVISHSFCAEHENFAEPMTIPMRAIVDSYVIELPHKGTSQCNPS